MIEPDEINGDKLFSFGDDIECPWCRLIFKATSAVCETHDEDD